MIPIASGVKEACAKSFIRAVPIATQAADRAGGPSASGATPAEGSAVAPRCEASRRFRCRAPCCEHGITDRHLQVRNRSLNHPFVWRRQSDLKSLAADRHETGLQD